MADKKAVKQSDTKAFAEMLLASHFSGNQLPATNQFLSSNLKKRLKMIKKPKTKYAYARRFFALPIMFTVAFAYMVDAKNKEIEKVNNDVEKSFESLKFENIIPESEKEAENISVTILKDTIKPPVSGVSSSNLKFRDNAGNPFQKQLKGADESDIFLIEGRKVTKSDFVEFFDKNLETPNYIFSHSAKKNDDIKVMIYSVAKNYDKQSSSVRNKLIKVEFSTK